MKSALANALYSINHTKNSAHQMTPALCNFFEFDPELRSRLYKDRKIERFKDICTDTLRKHVKANTPEDP